MQFGPIAQIDPGDRPPNNYQLDVYRKKCDHNRQYPNGEHRVNKGEGYGITVGGNRTLYVFGEQDQ